MIRKNKISFIFMIFSGTLFSLITIFKILQIVPIFYLAKEFAIPSTAAVIAVDVIDNGMTLVSVAAVITAIGTGGASLVAAAEGQALRAFIKSQIRKIGKKAVIAW
ncbi:MAG: uberolysin/carnocyclin family circular bacteriocin [Streptococcaceae bacterium]|jgi:circularin A/uberolysin family circular bacteriocin|nr:uberolysin/carnocyclin family circular bacteriocin [Streptococcaceae bacterium]